MQLEEIPQGFVLSPIFFSLYINGVFDDLKKNEDIQTQAYADDLIIQVIIVEKCNMHMT